jgi:hypothetical protein
MNGHHTLEVQNGVTVGMRIRLKVPPKLQAIAHALLRRLRIASLIVDEWISTHRARLRWRIEARQRSGSTSGLRPYRSVPFDVVVSSENTQYMAWQTQVFCFSCLTRLKLRPVVVVHQSTQPLREEFCLLQRYGCIVLEAPSFSAHPKGKYLPRNEAGSLLAVSQITALNTEHILLCEADMLFLKSLDYPDAVSGEFYRYLHYQYEHIRSAAQKFGLGRRIGTLNKAFRIGVPYLIPLRHARQIALRWLEVLDSFEAIYWIDIMFAFGIALMVEKLDAKTTCRMQGNLHYDQRVTRHLIHYGWANPGWDKRSYRDRSPFDDESLPFGKPGTVLAEMMSQIRETSNFFQLQTPVSISQKLD